MAALNNHLASRNVAESLKNNLNISSPGALKGIGKEYCVEHKASSHAVRTLLGQTRGAIMNVLEKKRE